MQDCHSPAPSLPPPSPPHPSLSLRSRLRLSTVLPRLHRSTLPPYPLSTWHHPHICRPNRVLVTQTGHKISRVPPSAFVTISFFPSGFLFLAVAFCFLSALLSLYFLTPTTITVPPPLSALCPVNNIAACCITFCLFPTIWRVHLSRQETAIKLNDAWASPQPWPMWLWANSISKVSTNTTWLLQKTFFFSWLSLIWANTACSNRLRGCSCINLCVGFFLCVCVCVCARERVQEEEKESGNDF